MISQEFNVTLKDSEGNNLLNPETTGAINLSNSRLFLLENGEPKLYKLDGGGILDNPYGISPTGMDGDMKARVQFQYFGNQKVLEGIIKWNETLADTLTFTFNSAENPAFLTKISEKDKTLWDIEIDQEYPIFVTLNH
ncbi:hypothetical protein [Algoriphagus sp. AK58]|uniref:hypothetical protein n=1 Tax=Algoriphagus sp. AK58 TaxID=1406877 RepID=UPI00165094AC|nr:hypothetical protein [Algoriphagus sp. AK58]